MSVAAGACNGSMATSRPDLTAPPTVFTSSGTRASPSLERQRTFRGASSFTPVPEGASQVRWTTLVPLLATWDLGEIDLRRRRQPRIGGRRGHRDPVGRLA